MKKKFIVIVVFLFLMFLISGCINILPTLEDDLIALGKGRLEIYLTDSSGDYKANDSETYSAVYVTISKIQVHLAGEDGEAEGEWEVLKKWEEGDEVEIDLIDLKEQGISLLLSENELIPNKYTQLRLFITEVSVLVEEGTDGKPVEIPSAYQTGIKLIHPFEIIEGEETVLTIDFDAEKSIIKTGDGNYKLKPVIKIITDSAEEVEEPAEE